MGQPARQPAQPIPQAAHVEKPYWSTQTPAQQKPAPPPSRVHGQASSCASQLEGACGGDTPPSAPMQSTQSPAGLQTVPVAQARPHSPQLSLSLPKSTQAPLQQIARVPALGTQRVPFAATEQVTGGAQAPNRQMAPCGQRRPQAPQFAGSYPRSVQVSEQHSVATSEPPETNGPGSALAGKRRPASAQALPFSLPAQLTGAQAVPVAPAVVAAQAWPAGQSESVWQLAQLRPQPPQFCWSVVATLSQAPWQQKPAP